MFQTDTGIPGTVLIEVHEYVNEMLYLAVAMIVYLYECITCRIVM